MLGLFFYSLTLPTIFAQPKGSSFNDDNKEFIRITIGKDTFIPAFEEAIQTMHVSGQMVQCSPNQL